MTVPTPPPRKMPPEIRDRIRRRVLAGLPGSRRSRARGPLAVAAGVVVLAAGAAIVAQSVGGGTPTPGGTPPPRPTQTAELDLAKANAELDRCYAASQLDGNQFLPPRERMPAFPPRAQWRPVLTMNYGAVQVTGARIGDRAVFCETTYTTVTISDPDVAPSYAPGSTTAALLVSRLGTVAGVVDPAWPWPWVEATGAGGTSAGPAAVRDGLFVAHDMGKVGPGAVRARADDPARGGADWQPLPAAPMPLRVLDRRPTTGNPYRTEADRAAQACVTAADQEIGVVDVESWASGAVIERGDDRFAMLRNDFGYSACWQAGGRVGFARYLAGPGAVSRPLALGSTLDLAGLTVLSGLVPPNCVRMRLESGVDVQVSNSTFAVLLPGGVPKSTIATLYDQNDRVIYEGPIESG